MKSILGKIAPRPPKCEQAGANVDSREAECDEFDGDLICSGLAQRVAELINYADYGTGFENNRSLKLDAIWVIVVFELDVEARALYQRSVGTPHLDPGSRG